MSKLFLKTDIPRTLVVFSFHGAFPSILVVRAIGHDKTSLINSYPASLILKLSELNSDKVVEVGRREGI